MAFSSLHSGGAGVSLVALRFRLGFSFSTRTQGRDVLGMYVVDSNGRRPIADTLTSGF